MKKSAIRKRYFGIKQNPSFKALWNYYRQAQKDFLKAAGQHKEIRAAHAKLKSTDGTLPQVLKAWKYECKRAKNYKKLHHVLLVEARKQVKKWLKLYLSLQRFTDNRPKLEQLATVTGSVKQDKPKAEKSPGGKNKAAKKQAKKAAAEVKKEAPKPSPRPAAKPADLPKAATAAVVKKEAPKPSPRPAAKPADLPKAATAAVVKKEAPKPSPRPAPKPADLPKTATAAAVAKPKTGAEPVAKVVAKPKSPAQADNLVKIEGIGEKIDQLLKGAGISSFEKLSKTTLDTLRGLLDKAGPRFNMHDPATWPKQAAFAAAGKWEELKKWQGELKAGKKK